MLLLIYAVAFQIRNKYYDDSPLKKYFIPGLSLKLIGALAAGVIYFFYYGDGDTINYYNRVIYITNVSANSSLVGWKIIFGNPAVFDWDTYGHYRSLRAYDTSQFLVVRFAAFFSKFTLGTYSGIALIFAALSFSGVWMLFKTFATINPKLIKEFAISCLFIPSVFFWGSGLFKDTIALGFVGWFTYCIYISFIELKRDFRIIAMLIISFYVLFVIKKYIIMAFLPALLFWVFFKYSDRIKNDFIRRSITPLIIVVCAFGAYVAVNGMGGSDDYWSVDQMTTRAKDMQWWHKEVKKIYGEGGGGSFYSIGSGDFSAANIIKSFPLAVNVTFFRPYLWEAHNPVMLLSAVESLILFIFTLRILFSVGLPKIFKISITNPQVFFALMFSIIFAFAVGFTSFNFGALVRYKIPCIPFFVMALFIIRHHANISKNTEALPAVE